MLATIQSVKPTTRNKASKLAKASGENAVIYQTEIGKRVVQLITTESLFNACPNPNQVAFVAKVDENGNNVD
jgi:hypothetical protein